MRAPLTGPLLIAADTLFVDAGDTVIAAPGASVVARRIAVSGSGDARLRIRSGTAGEGLQVTTAGIDGALNVVLETATGAPIPGPGSGPLALDGLRTPQVLTAKVGTGPRSTAESMAVADTLQQPWGIVGIELSAAIAAILFDFGTDDAIRLAQAMLQWTVGGCAALLSQRQNLPAVDFDNVGSVQSSAVGMLARTQAHASGSTYVSSLSTTFYETQIMALLEVAGTYDHEIAAFRSEQVTEVILESFARTLGQIYEGAQTPLVKSLQRLATQSSLVKQQLQNAAVQLHNAIVTVRERQTALLDAVKQQFQAVLVKTALETFSTVIMLYIGSAAALLDFPEVLNFEAGETVKSAKLAMDIAKQLIDAGKATIDGAIRTGLDYAGQVPTVDASAGALTGAQCLLGSLASFGSAVAKLWAVVDEAAGSTPVKLDPDLVAAVEKLPDLSGFSISGLDPVTYWTAIAVQTKAAVAPLRSQLPEAIAYLEAVELAQTYGSAVGDLQMKLLELYTQGMAAFDQLQQAAQGERTWDSLESSLAALADRTAAANGLLERGYLNVKRGIVLAVENYRAAFIYQWLQPSEFHVDATMDFATLKEQATNSIEDLQRVLTGGGTGAISGRQPFRDVTYIVDQRPLFTETDGKGQARFTIEPAQIADQLSDNTAVYVTDAKFELQGGEQPRLVQLQVTTSSHYANYLDGHVHRFVSQPFSGANVYKPVSGKHPDYTAHWTFTDAAQYLTPTPYTEWTVTVNQGDWRDATAIKVTLKGVVLQKASR